MKNTLFIILLFLVNTAIASPEAPDYDRAKAELAKLDIHYSTDELSTIPWLKLNDLDLSKVDLSFLVELQSLEKLNLESTGVSNDVLTYIVQLPNIKVLWLEGTNITDEATEQFKKLPNLKALFLPGNFSDSKIQELKTFFPAAEIERANTDTEEQDFMILSIILIAILIGIFLIVFFRAKFIKTKGKRVAFAFAIFMSLLFFLMLSYAIHFISVAEYTDGRVIKMIMRSHSTSKHSSTVFHPEIEFTAIDNRQYTFVSDMGSSPPGYEVGEPVKVMYDPENPEDAEIYSTMGKFTVFSYGFVFLIFAIILYGVSGVLNPIWGKIRGLFNKKLSGCQKMLKKYGVDKSLRELGNKHYCEIDLSRTDVADEDLEQLQSLPCLMNLNLNNTTIGDKGLSLMGEHKKLNNLSLNNTRITDNGLRYVAKQPKLELLYLENTSIGNRGISFLIKLKKLETLELNGTKVDKGCLEFLSLFKKMDWVSAENTGITDEDIREFEKKFPDITITN